MYNHHNQYLLPLRKKYAQFPETSTYADDAFYEAFGMGTLEAAPEGGY